MEAPGKRLEATQNITGADANKKPVRQILSWELARFLYSATVVSKLLSVSVTYTILRTGADLHLGIKDSKRASKTKEENDSKQQQTQTTTTIKTKQIRGWGKLLSFISFSRLF